MALPGMTRRGLLERLAAAGAVAIAGPALAALDVAEPLTVKAHDAAVLILRGSRVLGDWVGAASAVYGELRAAALGPFAPWADDRTITAEWVPGDPTVPDER